MPQRRRAYTLSELALTLLVIMFAATLTYPVLLMVFPPEKEKWRQTACLTNQKQLGMALLMYAQDYDDKFPGGTRPRVVKNRPPFRSITLRAMERQDWPNQLWPYFKNSSLLRCPKDDTPITQTPLTTWSDVQAAVGRDEYPISYTLNAWVGYGVGTGTLMRRSQWIVLAERNNVAQAASDGPLFFPWMWAAPETHPVWSPLPHVALVRVEATRDLALTRHGEGSNFVFADGHAKFFPFERACQECCFFPEIDAPTTAVQYTKQH